ncbi:hypothetical protein Cni_G11525 [Canna indica]|uniref:Uncharacterized protein n=1 Tax=Canna indica TaxID=4628 RepID=A0AAQ3QAY3_9LILI|nr:hypothetical protein Cni_G11525 [Canna indica]
MERGEPTFVPEWYKGSGGSASGNSNHHSRSSLRSDEQGVRHLSRDRSSASAFDVDYPRPSAFSDRRFSSYQRSVSSNDSSNHAGVSTSNLRPYNSFGRSYRDNDRKKDNDLHERSRSIYVNNGFSHYTNSTIASRNKRDTLRRTSSSVGRLHEPLSKRTSSESSNGLITGTSIDYNGKHSFEKEFPSLGIEEKQPDVARVSSPGLTALDNISRMSSMAIGGDGWTSALVEAPVRVGGNEPTNSCATSTALSSSTRLNMAEALAQAPPQARDVSQESVDVEKIKELNRMQCIKLIPIRPSVPKSLVLNSLEKSKVKGTRSGEYSVLSKGGLQSASQHTGQSLRAPARSDAVKISQAGNIQVLNREKNDVTPIARDGLNLRNVCSAEKRSNSQVQNRNDFFNIIRRKAPVNRSPDRTEPRSVSAEKKEDSASCFGLEPPTESDNGARDNNSSCEVPKSSFHSEEEISSSDPLIAISLPDDEKLRLSSNPRVIKCLNESGDGTFSSDDPDAVPRSMLLTDNGDMSSFLDSVIPGFVPEKLDEVFWDYVPPSEEEAAFLRSLGWNDNAGIDALTHEEIAGFFQKHPEQKSSPGLDH